MVKAIFDLARSKAEQEDVARSIAEASDDPALRQICSVFEQSSRIIGEDLWRESGYIIAQSEATRTLLKTMIKEHGDLEGFPLEEVEELLSRLS